MNIPDKLTKDDWLQIMIDSVVFQMLHKMDDLGMSRDQAITAVKKESCAGTLAWEKVLEILDNN